MITVTESSGRSTRLLIGLLAAAALAACGARAPPPVAQGPARFGEVSEARVIGSATEPDQWFTPGRDLGGSFYSSLDAINPTTVEKLGFAWDYRTGTTRGLEATPVVVDGVMYTSGNWGRVYALEAATGRELWTYDPGVPGQYGRYACCDVVNRGVVVRDGRVYVASLDGYLHAIDARTGQRVWRVDTFAARGSGEFHYFVTGAPLIAGDQIVIGNGGSDFKGARGSVSAYDLATGAFRWRFYTVPRDPRHGPQDQPHLTQALKTWDRHYDWDYGGGGSVWDGMAYDHALHLVYIGTANASPYAADRGGNDELYVASIVAIHADSGTYAWHYQEIPGEGWDYDTTAKIVLADVPFHGQARQVLLQASKNGFLYVLDRATGEFLSGEPFAHVTWTKGLDPKSHRPISNPAADWKDEPKLIYPGATGAHGWQPMSFSAKTGLVYIPVMDAPMVYVNTEHRPAGLIEGNFDLAFFFPEDYDPKGLAGLLGKLPSLDALARRAKETPRSRGVLRAVEPATGKVAWEHETSSAWDGGVLSTGGNLVIQGDAAGFLNVYAADSGKLLKRLEVGSSIMAAPMTYRVGGEQYVAVMAAYGGGVLFNPFPASSAAFQRGNAGRIVAFRLGGTDVPKSPILPDISFPEPPAREGTPAQLAHGEVLYNRFCARCHAFGRALLPDLRRLSPDTHRIFYDIVLDGAYQAKGMASWKDVLSRADAETIHAYLVDQTWQARAAQTTTTR